MIIVIEGPDGVGKTTLINAIRKAWGDTTVTVRQGPPPTGISAVEHYVTAAIDLVKAHEKLTLVITDRLHAGELVYGPILRGASRLSTEEYNSITHFLVARGALLVHCTLPEDIMIDRLVARDGGKPDEKSGATIEHAPAIRQAFIDLLDDDSSWFTLDMQDSPENLANSVLRYIAVRKPSTPTDWQFTRDWHRFRTKRESDAHIQDSRDRPNATSAPTSVRDVDDEVRGVGSETDQGQDHPDGQTSTVAEVLRRYEERPADGDAGVQTGRSVDGSRTETKDSSFSDIKEEVSGLLKLGSDTSVAISKMVRDRVFQTGDQLLRYAVQLAMTGEQAAPRGIGVREHTRPTTLTLTDVHRPFLVSPVRRPNYRFGLAEAAWILSGSDDAQLIAKYNKRMLEFSDDGKRLWGAYGPRLMGQLEHVISTLKRDPDSRQAVVTTWRPMIPALQSSHDWDSLKAAGVVSTSHVPGHERLPICDWDGASWRSKDVPCTVAWHFQLRNNKLELTMFMRSNDVWLGMPYDILCFTTVQRIVAAVLGVECGHYHHIASNLHLYDSHYEDAERLMKEPRYPYDDLPVMPAFFGWEKSDASAIAYNFKHVFVKKDIYSEDLTPFAAAVNKRPELSSMYHDLMRATRPTRKFQSIIF